MASARIAAAHALVADVEAALEAAGLTKATATIDAAKAPSGARHGVVVVSPPELTFAGWGDPDATWELHVIAGPATDYLAAWAVIDAIIDALVLGGINIARGVPGAYQPQQGQPLPAYTLTLNPLE